MLDNLEGVEAEEDSDSWVPEEDGVALVGWREAGEEE